MSGPNPFARDFAKRSPPPADSPFNSDDEDMDLAPLPTIPNARNNARARASSSSASASENGLRNRSASNGSRPRPRAFSAGAGAGAVPTVGGEAPESLREQREADTKLQAYPPSQGRPRAMSTLSQVVRGEEPAEVFPPLKRTATSASRVSQRSNMTFADAAALVNLPELSRPMTKTEKRARARAGTVTTMASLRLHAAISEDEKEDLKFVDKDEEELVAVQVTDTGDEIVYPDGGLKAWLVLAGGFCAAVSAFGLAGSVGAFQSHYQQTLLKEYNSSQIAWIGSTQAAVCFASCLFTGPLFDRYGCRPLLAAGTFLLVLAFCLLSLATKFYQIFLCHATLMAMGMDLMFIVPMGAVGQWFFLKRGLAFGILMTGSSMGAIVWPLIVANLPARIGFPWTVRLIALIIGVLGSIATLLVKTRLPPRPPGPFFHFAEFKNPAYLMVALSFPFFAFGFFSFLTFIGTYGTLAGLGTLAPYLLMIANGASGFGRVSAGLVADRLGTYNVHIIGQLMMVILMFCWLAMKSAGPLIALCILYGFASGAPVSLQAPSITASATDPRLAGTLIGQALMVQSIAQLCGPPIFGAIIGGGSQEEQFKQFPKAIVFGCCMLTVSMLLVTGARLTKSRKLYAIC